MLELYFVESTTMFRQRELFVDLSYFDDSFVLVKPRGLTRAMVLSLSRHLGVEGFKRHYKLRWVDASRVRDWCRFQKIICRDLLDTVKRLINKKGPKVVVHKELSETTLWTSLFPYQREGVAAAITAHFGKCLIADDMGLGKTYQALTFIDYYRQHTPILMYVHRT